MPWPQHFICCMPDIMPLLSEPMPIMPLPPAPMPILSAAAGLSAAGGAEGFVDESCARTAEPAATLATKTSAAIAISVRLFMSFGCLVSIENAPLISGCFSRRDQKPRARLAPASSPIPLPPFIAATSKKRLVRNAACGSEVVEAGQSKLHRALAKPPPENAPGIPPYRRNRPSRRTDAKAVTILDNVAMGKLRLADSG